MAQVVPAGKPIGFEYSVYSGDAALPVAMKVYDLSSGTPVLSTTVAMVHVFNGTYFVSYTFPDNSQNKNYLIQKSVYTNGTFATPDGTYSPGSEIVEIEGLDNESKVV